MAKFGTLVDVPPTNVKVDLPGSMVHIQRLGTSLYLYIHTYLCIYAFLFMDISIFYILCIYRGAAAVAQHATASLTFNMLPNPSLLGSLRRAEEIRSHTPCL